MNYFTSDWHIGEDRIGINNKPNLFYRPFKSIDEQNDAIINNLKHIKPTDTLYVLGDVIVNPQYIHHLDKIPNCKRILVLGNYDDQNMLKPYFDEITHGMVILINNTKTLLTHFPTKGKSLMDKYKTIKLTLTGHVHGLWKVQKNLINVSTDAWHFKPVSQDEIVFCYNGMNNHYDENVFPY